MSEPIMNDWYKWAETLNKFAWWVTLILAVVWWLVESLWVFVVVIFSPLNPAGLYYLITGVVAAILYLLVVQKKVAAKDQTMTTHIWLIICAVLGAAEIIIPLVFLFYSILSDHPIWNAAK